VGWINARRRRPVAGYAALLLGLVVVGLLYGALTRTGAQAAPTTAQEDIANGQALFEATCSSCHGLDAQGTDQAPSLIGAGAAAGERAVEHAGHDEAARDRRVTGGRVPAPGDDRAHSVSPG
jgi:mono/diheme cytochrome c family protein